MHPDDIAARLLSWYGRNGRDLPWRKTYDPYHVWLSEVMLQQTQMARGAARFASWIERFPALTDVAEASREMILSAWEGLGYYARAKNFHRAARLVVETRGGRIPDTRAGLEALPGVGPYTAAAVAAIAFERDEVVVDANVERVAARLFDIDAPVKTAPGAALVRTMVAQIQPPGRARDFCQAMMDFGALVCSPRAPRCDGCLLASGCQAHRLGIASERPVPVKAAAITPLEVATAVLVDAGRVFIQKRLSRGVWADLWEFPGGRIEPGESPVDAAARELAEETGYAAADIRPITVVRHGYTTYRVRLHCFFCSLAGPRREPALTAAQDHRWALPGELGVFAMPAGHRKLADHIEARGLWP